MWGINVAEPNEALIIAGGKPGADDYKIVVGGRAFVWPVVQKCRRLDLSLNKAEVMVDCPSTQGIKVEVKGIVAFKIADDEQSIVNAAKRFLSKEQTMEERVIGIFAGHLRSIVGSMTIEDMIRDRQKLAAQVRDACGEEVSNLGFTIDSFQIEAIGDPSNYIAQLAKPHLAAVEQNARIAEARANQAAAEQEQQATAKVAEARRNSEITQAKLQAEVDQEKATAAQAGPQAGAEARKAVVEKETEVARLSAARAEQDLAATVRKPAEAARYQREQEAEAEKKTAILQAEASQAQGLAQAEVERQQGLAQAQVTEAKGKADAAGISARAAALAENQEAVIGQQIAERLPDTIKAAASAFQGVDSLTIWNGAEGVEEIIGQVLGQGGKAAQLARQLLEASTTNGTKEVVHN